MKRSPEAYEVALYSDSRFVGHLLDLGPFEVFNTVADGEPRLGAGALALVLRVNEYGGAYINRVPTMQEATVGTYHGGWMADEIAALVSLALGVRCQAGEIVRQFKGANDRGIPTQWSPRQVGVLIPTNPGRSAMIPASIRRAELDAGRDLLRLFPQTSAMGAAALIRAARQFQSALWTADDDANGAWLRLVSAIEVAAAYHVSDSSPWPTVESGWPRIAELIRPLPQDQRDAIATELAPQVRAAARFRRFLKDFRPSTPTSRPPEYAQVPWSSGRLRKSLMTVYDHRSRALHGGIPFPLPMCISPRPTENGIAEEKPLGLGTGSGDAYWPAAQTPMHLHVFSHIVREALQSWWRALANV